MVMTIIILLLDARASPLIFDRSIDIYICSFIQIRGIKMIKAVFGACEIGNRFQELFIRHQDVELLVSSFLENKLETNCSEKFRLSVYWFRLFLNFAFVFYCLGLYVYMFKRALITLIFT